MKKILLSTAAAVAIATGALSLGTSGASAGYYGGYYGFKAYKAPHCYTEYRTIKVRWKKVWSSYRYRWVWKYRYIQKPFKVCY